MLFGKIHIFFLNHGSFNKTLKPLISLIIFNKTLKLLISLIIFNETLKLLIPFIIFNETFQLLISLVNPSPSICPASVTTTKASGSTS